MKLHKLILYRTFNLKFPSSYVASADSFTEVWHSFHCFLMDGL